MASWVLSGSLLLAVLIWDGHCVPLTKGQNPSPNYGGGQAYPGGGHAGGGHGGGGHGGGGHGGGGLATPGFGSGGLSGGAAAGFGSGGLSGGSASGGGVLPGYPTANIPVIGPTSGGLAGTGSNLGGLAAGSFSAGAAPTGTHPGGALPSTSGFGVAGALPGPAAGSPAAAAGLAFYGAASPGVLSSSQPDLTWSVEPTAMDADPTSYGGGHGVLPPPGPVADFVPGEMAHYERAFEHGHRDTETQDQGYLATGAVAAGGGQMTGQGAGLGSGPGYGMGAGSYPMGYRPPGINFGQYPYDYQFLTGNYPPGTVTHYSDSFEQGKDRWDEGHYMDYHIPLAPPADQKPMQPPPQQVTYQEPFKKPFPQRRGR